MAASLSGGEFMHGMVGGALASTDGMTRAQLTVTVQGTFQKIFLIGAAVALISVALTMWKSDETLHGHAEN